MVDNVESKVSRDNLDQLLKEIFTDDVRPEWMTVKGVTMAATYAKYADIIENFHVRDGDVWVCTLPKSGTMWAQEMIWCIANDLDFEGGKVDIWDRFPFFEFSTLVDFEGLKKRTSTTKVSRSKSESMKYIEKLPSPRFIKTHLPYHLLPRELREGKTRAKIIHLSRNPKDTCVSYFHHCIQREGYRGNFEQFCTLFLAGKVGFLPYWDHLYGYLSQRNNSKMNILFLKYEDMKANLEDIINQVSAFLGKPSLSPEDMDKILDHLSFEKMKTNSSLCMDGPFRSSQSNVNTNKDNVFFRSGEINQWKAEMTPELIKKFDEWISSNSPQKKYSTYLIHQGISNECFMAMNLRKNTGYPWTGAQSLSNTIYHIHEDQRTPTITLRTKTNAEFHAELAEHAHLI